MEERYAQERQQLQDRTLSDQRRMDQFSYFDEDDDI